MKLALTPDLISVIHASKTLSKSEGYPQQPEHALMDTMDHHLTVWCDMKTARHVQHKKTQRALDALKTLACQRIRHLEHAHVTKDGLVTHQTVFHVVQIVNPVWVPESQTAKPVLQTQHSLQIK